MKATIQCGGSVGVRVNETTRDSRSVSLTEVQSICWFEIREGNLRIGIAELWPFGGMATAQLIGGRLKL